MGGDVISYRLRPGAAAAGHLVRELGLPREALVNVIVRDGRAIPPRGSTEVREGDELHILVRGELRDEVEELTERWHEGPVGDAAAAAPAASRRRRRSSPSARARGRRRPLLPRQRRRDRRGRGPAQPARPPSALVALADGRYAVTTEGIVAVGGRQALARWCERRADAAAATTPPSEPGGRRSSAP